MPRRLLSSASLSPGAVVPIVLAIGVAGTLYGAAAQPVFGTWMTLFSSVVVFSGTVQFTMVALIAAGATPIAVLGATFLVNVRNFALGGALRPHLTGTRVQRTVLSWFLIDETVGLALADPGRSDHILQRVGLLSYSAWVVGTAVGVAGGAALGLAGLAEAVFPVLFIGLAALMVRDLRGVGRALLGALITIVLLLVWPGLEGLAPVIGGVTAAIPGDGSE